MIKKAQQNIKFNRPSVSNIYPRHRLLQQLKNEDDTSRHFWIAGPAGSGKTSLVNSYAATQSDSIIWFRVENLDQDPHTFIQNIYYAGGVKPKATASFDQPEKIIREFFKQLEYNASANILWVWDNCEYLMPDSVQMQSLAAILDLTFIHLRMVFTSRQALPPCFLRLQISQRMSVIDWQDLSLQADETTAICKLFRGNEIDTQQIDQLHQLSNGWLASLILLLQKKNITTTSVMDSYSSDAFDYLAAEVLNDLTDKCRLFLWQIAVLPYAPIKVLIAISEEQHVEKCLDQLSNQLHLLERSVSSDTVIYRLHPLLKTFLVNELTNNEIPINLPELYDLAAEAFVTLGLIEHACDLYIEAKNWERLSFYTLSLADGLAQNGRYQTLIGLLDALPSSYINEDKWLFFWLGSCKRFSDKQLASDMLETVFQQFIAEKDVRGQYLAWFTIVESIIYSFDDMSPFIKWIKEYDKLKKRAPHCPGIGLRIKVTATAALAMSVVQPSHPRFRRLVKISEIGVRFIPSRTLRTTIFSYLAFHYLSSGEIARFHFLTQQLKPSIDDVSLSFDVRSLSYAMIGLHEIISGDTAPHKKLDAGMVLSEQQGRGIFTNTLQAYRIYCYAMELELSAARLLLAEFNNELAFDRRMDTSHHDFIDAWLLALSGDIQKAMTVCVRAKQVSKNIGFDFGQALNINLHAQLLVINQNYNQAEQELNELSEIINRGKSQLLTVMYGFSRAWLALATGDKPETLLWLKKTLKIVQEQGILAYPGFYHFVIAKLAYFAIEQGLIDDHLLQIIRRWKLQPPGSATPILAWPWQIKIWALGKFSVEIEGQLIDTSKRTHQRALELLQVLVALGGENVAKSDVCHALWPDSDGDKANHALENLLHRLRKLTGAEVIKMQAGKISINLSLCWIDINALDNFERNTLISSESHQNKQVLLFDLYQGELLAGEEHLWVLHAQDKVRNQFLRCAKQLGRDMIAQNETDSAIDLWKKALQFEPLSEPLYLNLIQTFMVLGRHSEALLAYRRCKQLLDTSLGIPPCQAIELAVQKLI